MKLQITVNIQTDDGAPGAEPTQIEVEVPNFEAFSGPEAFGAVFHEDEQQVIKARNKAIEVATEKYLTELAKKNLSQKPSCEAENSLPSQMPTAEMRR